MKKKLTLADKARKCLRMRAIGKKCYQRADRLLEEIAGQLKPGEGVEIDARGRRAVLVDQFAKKFVVFRPLGFRRYDLEVQDPL